ncbi:MAG TPA: DUF6788 family protein [Acidimicrobiales bacterium]|nr:DUF6788 family protein [Acidimicrobiales bacterium]
MSKPPAPEPSEQAELQRILAELATIGYCLPGSVTARSLPCGRRGCACKADPPRLHGPYCQWSRKIEGKTVSRWLSSEQLERYEAWFANARRARELLSELEALSLRIAERAEGWEPQAPPSGHRRREGNTREREGPHPGRQTP